MGMKSQGTKLEIGSGTGSPVTLVTANVNYPTIISKAAHGLNNGDVVVLSAFEGADAALLNGQSVIVKYAKTDQLAIDIDTVGKTITAAVGTLTPAEWTELGEIVDFNGPGGAAAVIDTTHLGSTRKEKLMGIPDEGQYAINVNWKPNDLGQQAARAARAAGTLKHFRVTYTDGSTATFQGYVLSVASSGGVDGKVAGSITIEITGEVIYA